MFLSRASSVEDVEVRASAGDNRLGGEDFNEALVALASGRLPEVATHPRGDPVRVAPVIDPARACDKPHYPVISRRLSEQGDVVLRFLVGSDGSVRKGAPDPM